MSNSTPETGEGGGGVAEDVEREGEGRREQREGEGRREQVDTNNGTRNTSTAEGREVTVNGTLSSYSNGPMDDR